MARNTQKIVKLVPLLEEIEFIGLATLLGIDLLDEEGEEKNFADLLEEMLAKFDKLPKVKRKELYQLVKSATKGRTSADMKYRRGEDEKENVESAPSSETSEEVDDESEN